MKIEFMYKDADGNLHIEMDQELAMVLANMYRDKIRNLVYEGDISSMQEAYENFKAWNYIISTIEQDLSKERDFSELAKNLGLDKKEEQEESAEVSDSDCTNTAPEDEPSTNNIKFYQ